MVQIVSSARAGLLGVLALGLLAACGPGWAYRAEGRFERDLSVRTSVRLTVENPSGTVRVRRGEPGRVRVVGHMTVRALSRKRAQAWLQRVMAEPPVVQTDGDVRVEWPTWAPRSWGIFGGPWGLRIDYTVDVPSETDVRITTGSGDVEVRDVDGPVRVRTGSGDLEVQAIRSAVEVRTGSGDVRIEDVQGDTDVRAGSGDVRLKSATGRVTVRLGSGDLTADRVDGPVEAATGSGDIALTDVAGDLRVRTGSGDIVVRTHQSLKDRTWDLTTGSGDVEMALPETARFEIDARTRAGRVTVEFPLTTVWVQERRHLRGVVGSADLRIEARVGSGSVRVRRAPSPTPEESGSSVSNQGDKSDRESGEIGRWGDREMGQSAGSHPSIFQTPAVMPVSLPEHRASSRHPSFGTPAVMLASPCPGAARHGGVHPIRTPAVMPVSSSENRPSCQRPPPEQVGG